MRRSCCLYPLCCGVALVLLALLKMAFIRDDQRLVVSLEGDGIVFPVPGTHWRYPDQGENLQAYPRADSGQGFVGWRGDVVADEYHVPLDMTAPRSVTAVFSETPAPGATFHAVTVAMAGMGRGATTPVPGRYLFRRGDRISLTGEPAPGHYFAGWRIVEGDAPASLSLYPSRTVTVSGDLAAVAWFSDAGFLLTLESEGPGRLSWAPGDYALAANSIVSVHALPDDGARLKHWTDGEGAPLSGPDCVDGHHLQLEMTTAVARRAVFEPALRRLTLRTQVVAPAAGTTIPASNEAGITHEFAHGASITLEAFPVNGSSAFAGWTGDRLPLLSDAVMPRLALKLLEDMELTAHFAPAEVTLRVDALVDGMEDDRAHTYLLPPPGTYGYLADEANTVALTALLPDGGELAFIDWRDEGGDAHTSDYDATVVMNRDRHLTARFTTQDILSLKVIHIGAGGGTTAPAPGRYPVVPGRAVRLEAMPAPDQYFGGWRIMDEQHMIAADIMSPRTLVVDAGVEIQAQFELTGHYVRFGTIPTGGAIAPVAGEYAVAHGAVIDMTVIPEADRHFHHWQSETQGIISEAASARVIVTDSEVYTAVFGVPLFSLETMVEGSGRVETSLDRTNRIPANTSVTLRAWPAPDAVFESWGGDTPPGATLTHPELFLNMDADKRVTAEFRRADWQLVVAVEGLEEDVPAGFVPAPGAYGYRAHEEVRLFACPPVDSDRVFLGWRDEDGAESIDPEQLLVMESDRRVVAVFGPVDSEDNVTLTVLAPQGPGRVRGLEPGVYRFRRGATLPLYAEMNEGAFFGGWRGDYEDEIRYNPLPIQLDVDRTLGPQFAHSGTTLALMLDSDGGGTMFPPPGIYRLAAGVTVVLSAMRTDGDASFLGWTNAAGERLSRHGRYEFVLRPESERMEIIALFRRYVPLEPLMFCQASDMGYQAHFTF